LHLSAYFISLVFLLRARFLCRTVGFHYFQSFGRMSRRLRRLQNRTFSHSRACYQQSPDSGVDYTSPNDDEPSLGRGESPREKESSPISLAADEVSSPIDVSSPKRKQRAKHACNLCRKRKMRVCSHICTASHLNKVFGRKPMRSVRAEQANLFIYNK
jgi:hypothetical protein